MSLPKRKQKVTKVTCMVCGEVLTKYNIGMHVKKYHNLDSTEYKIKHGLKKDPALQYGICESSICGKEFKKSKPSSRCCSNECYKHLKKEKRLENSLSKHTDKSKYAECQICKFRGKNITRHILVAHEITVDEYKELYSESIISDDYRNGLSERYKGELNPAYNHGGKFSPVSKKFIKYKDLSEEEIDSNISEVLSKIAKSNKENGNNNCTLIYYTKRGYSEQEAKELLSERQRTFTLDKCIERYGDEEGRKIHKERQERWQKTISSKSDEELDNINKRKSSKINFNSLWSRELDESGYFYIIKLSEDRVKIGITSRDIYKRYKTIKESMVYLFESAENISHAFMIEQIIKRLFIDTIRKNDYGEFGWTEVLNDINIYDIENISKYLLNSYEETKKYFLEIKNGTFI